MASYLSYPTTRLIILVHHHIPQLGQRYHFYSIDSQLRIKLSSFYLNKLLRSINKQIDGLNSNPIIIINFMSNTQVSSIISILYNRLSTHQNEDNRCSTHIHEYRQYICKQCEQKQILYCQECIKQHSQKQHSGQEYERYGKYLNSVRERYMREIMELEQHYREKKDYSVREMRIRHEGKEKSLNEMSNEIVLRVNSVIEKIRRSIEERWVSFKNTSLEPTYVKHFQEIKVKISEMTSTEMASIQRTDQHLKRIKEQCQQQLNQIFKRKVRECEGQLKQMVHDGLMQAIGSTFSQQKQCRGKGVDEVIQNLKVQLSESERAWKQKIDKYKYELRQKTNEVSKLQQIISHKEVQIYNLTSLSEKQTNEMIQFKDIKSEQLIQEKTEECEEQQDYGMLDDKIQPIQDQFNANRIMHSKSSDDVLHQFSQVLSQKKKNNPNVNPPKKLQKKALRKMKLADKSKTNSKDD